MKKISVLTSFDANDCASESQWDGEALPDVDDSVEEAVLCLRVCNHTLLLLQGLHTNTGNQYKIKQSIKKTVFTKRFCIKQ